MTAAEDTASLLTALRRSKDVRRSAGLTIQPVRSSTQTRAHHSQNGRNDAQDALKTTPSALNTAVYPKLKGSGNVAGRNYERGRGVAWPLRRQQYRRTHLGVRGWPHFAADDVCGGRRGDG